MIYLGTMDAMMAVKGDVWNPPEQVVQDCTKEVQEVMRCVSFNRSHYNVTPFSRHR